ncbi:alpha/beta hydrolase [Acrocarpospora phusangensis]|uniref:Alpha/beta hydrolase n=1 Tax=Acrocarpospora phusangensis TaxID=1070424 RepID=A0A919Q6W1_9ACTN|nr:alpha/beta hydrolase [Acrocarpospora phusangensis]GIH23261.1 alpha/beta hydrolase [Acrocarpospora phusangensis]
MANFVLLPGGGSGPGYWWLLEEELRRRGHGTVAVDLPYQDEKAGLEELADAAVQAIGDRRDLVVVAHSFGGFTGPLICERLPVELLVYVAGMIPRPGETPGDWWENTGHKAALRESQERDGVDPDSQSVYDMFFQDVPREIADVAMTHERDHADTSMITPWPGRTHPDVPTRALICTDDRCFPANFMRELVRDRLGLVADEMPSGHSPMLSRTSELADRLEGFLTDLSK